MNFSEWLTHYITCSHKQLLSVVLCYEGFIFFVFFFFDWLDQDLLYLQVQHEVLTKGAWFSRK